MKMLYLIIAVASISKASAEDYPLSRAAQQLAATSKELRLIIDDPSTDKPIQSDAINLRQKVDGLWAEAVMIPYNDAYRELEQTGFYFETTGDNPRLVSLKCKTKEKQNLVKDAYDLKSNRWQLVNQAMTNFLAVSNQALNFIYKFQLGDTVSSDAYVAVSRQTDRWKTTKVQEFKELIDKTLNCIDFFGTKLTALNLSMIVGENGSFEWSPPIDFSELGPERRAHLKMELKDLADHASSFGFTCVKTKQASFILGTAEKM